MSCFSFTESDVDEMVTMCLQTIGLQTMSHISVWRGLGVFLGVKQMTEMVLYRVCAGVLILALFSGCVTQVKANARQELAAPTKKASGTIVVRFSKDTPQVQVTLDEQIIFDQIETEAFIVERVAVGMRHLSIIWGEGQFRQDNVLVVEPDKPVVVEVDVGPVEYLTSKYWMFVLGVTLGGLFVVLTSSE